MSNKQKVQHTRVPTKRQLSKIQREKRRRRITLIAGIIILLMLTGVLGYGYYDTQIKPWSQVVVEVNDAKFDMDYYVKIFRFATGGQSDNAELLQFTNSVLHHIADNELIREGAPGCGVSVIPEEVTEKIREDILGTSPGDEETMGDADFEKLYQQRLKEIRLSDEEYRQFVQSDLLRVKMSEHLAEQFSPSSPVPQIHLHVIMLESEEKAKEIASQLNNGGDFAELAKENSLDKISGEKGGDLGWIPCGLLSPELEEVVFSLDLNTVSQPISVQEMYHLLMVSEKKDAELEDSQREALKSNALPNWLSSQRKNSVVKYHFGPEQYSWVADHL